MNKVLFYLAALLAVTGAAAIAAMLVAPRINWSATAPPGTNETRIARYVIRAWIKNRAGNRTIPLSETALNVQSAKSEFSEHCAFCHGLDGSGRNHLEADVYPPIPKINALQSWTDAELFFVVANGISLSTMPGFSANHDAEDIWKTVLWVRHLPKLTPAERAAIEKEIEVETTGHEKTMGQMPKNKEMHSPVTPNP